jgi:phytoene dehydrogenase-like protein
MADERFDAVVIGAGVGGLCAAARLAAGGWRVLIVEREPRVGGRASTEEVEGFKLPTGGVALELGGPMERLAREAGARYDVREPGVGVIVRAGGRSLDTTSGVMRLLVDGVALRAGRRLTRAWGPDPRADEVTLEVALARLTRNAMVHRLARNFTAGLFGLNADEVPWRAVATYLTQKGAFRRYGFCPRGSVGVMEDLAAVVQSAGGAVWRSSSATAIELGDGRARAVTVIRDGAELRVECDAVISNAGPAATVELLGRDALPAAYIREIAERDTPTPMIVVDIASREPLIDEAGIVFFADTTRLSAIAHLTSSCPEVAPPGWHLYVAYSVPVPALAGYDEAAETATTLRELEQEMPGFSRARVLRVRTVKDDWPAQRAASGREAPMQTPVANVINVGDGVRLYGDGGTQACAVTGRIAADRLLALRRSARRETGDQAAIDDELGAGAVATLL